MKEHKFKYRIAIQQFEHGMPTHFRNVMIISPQQIGMIQKDVELGFEREHDEYLKQKK